MLCFRRIPAAEKLLFPLLFTLTFVCGLWASGFFDCYRIVFYVERHFTEKEAEAWVGKKVENTCSKKDPWRGKVVGWSLVENKIHIQVVFPEIREKLVRPEINYSYSGAWNCLKVIE